MCRALKQHWTELEVEATKPGQVCRVLCHSLATRYGIRGGSHEAGVGEGGGEVEGDGG